MITKATFNLEACIKAIKCLSALVIKFTFYHTPLNCTLTFSRHPWGTLRAGGLPGQGVGSPLLCLPVVPLFGCSGGTWKGWHLSDTGVGMSLGTLTLWDAWVIFTEEDALHGATVCPRYYHGGYRVQTAADT